MYRDQNCIILIVMVMVQRKMHQVISLLYRYYYYASVHIVLNYSFLLKYFDFNYL